VSGDMEQVARRIAERGPDALLERLRGAYEEAVATYAQAVKLDDERLEEMVRDAVERADGLQWRRALAAVAADELGIGLGEALSHPAVVRAHAILAAPSYEEGLARLGPLRTLEESEEGEQDDEPVDDELRHDPMPQGDRPEVRLVATHLGGIADLESPEPDVELWLSDDGLDIIRSTKEPLGRLTWKEVNGLEVPPARGLFGRRRRPRAYLVIRAEGGDASFEIDGIEPDELREQLAASELGPERGGHGVGPQAPSM
jgi:hypothetical protein